MLSKAGLLFVTEKTFFDNICQYEHCKNDYTHVFTHLGKCTFRCDEHKPSSAFFFRNPAICEQCRSDIAVVVLGTSSEDHFARVVCRSCTKDFEIGGSYCRCGESPKWHVRNQKCIGINNPHSSNNNNDDDTDTDDELVSAAIAASLSDKKPMSNVGPDALGSATKPAAAVNVITKVVKPGARCYSCSDPATHWLSLARHLACAKHAFDVPVGIEVHERPKCATLDCVSESEYVVAGKQLCWRHATPWLQK